MNSSVAPAPWPRAAGTAAAAWRIGAEWRGEGAGARIEWLLKRNCSITPRQLFGVYLSLCAASLAIAGGFAWVGASPVLVFAGVELLLVGAALLLYARHALDHERITLSRPGAVRRTPARRAHRSQRVSRGLGACRAPVQRPLLD